MAGFIRFEVSTDRVAVFIDYQNAYSSARRAYFHGRDPSPRGQFDPLTLANHLAEDSPFDRALHRVRIYRGRPEVTKEPRAYAANRRQVARWQRAGCEVVSRVLRYPRDWPDEKAVEKGIDVQLAIDFVMMALRGEYDVGILFSTDTDLEPALEAVTSMRGPVRAEVAAWNAPDRPSPRLSIRGAKVWCHWIQPETYHAHRDDTDYNVAG